MLHNFLCQFLRELGGYHQAFSIFVLPIASNVVAKSKCIISSRTRIRGATPISSTLRPLHLKVDIWPPVPSRKLMYKTKRAPTFTQVLFLALTSSDFQVGGWREAER